MKKGKYIDYNIIMACLSSNKERARFRIIDEMISKAHKDSSNAICKKSELLQESKKNDVISAKMIAVST